MIMLLLSGQAKTDFDGDKTGKCGRTTRHGRSVRGSATSILSHAYCTFVCSFSAHFSSWIMTTAALLLIDNTVIIKCECLFVCYMKVG